MAALLYAGRANDAPAPYKELLCGDNAWREVCLGLETREVLHGNGARTTLPCRAESWRCGERAGARSLRAINA